MLSTELFALAHGHKCSGDQECHWCTGPCERHWIHDDLPIVPFVRTNSHAKRPGNAYICWGCWLYRRGRITVSTLQNELIDRQNLMDHSWILFDNQIKVIKKEDKFKLYEILLNPPLVFCLSLLNEPSTKNLIQLSILNENEKIFANTPIHFTLNNIQCEYTIYELEEALKTQELTGKSPGVRLLIETIGPCVLKEKEKRGRGRPPKEDDPDGKIVTRKIK